MIEVVEVKRQWLPVRHKRKECFVVKVVILFDHRIQIVFSPDYSRLNLGYFRETGRLLEGADRLYDREQLWVPEIWYPEIMARAGAIFAENKRDRRGGRWVKKIPKAQQEVLPF